MIRLRYKEYPSNPLFLCTNLVVINSNLIICGVIDSTTFEYIVKNADGTILSFGSMSSIRDAKLAVRNDFEKLGVVFDGEIRKRDSQSSNRSA